MNWRSIPALLVALVASWSFVCGTVHAQTSTVGQWNLGPVWDIATVHTMLTPNGQVIFWPGDYISGDDPRLWDPITSTLTSLPRAGYDLFCVGHAFLGDGTLFVAGGNLQTPYNGLPNASIYNPFTNVWTRLPDMNAARWYPTTTFTGTGEVLVMTGDIDSVQLENPLPQVWQPSTGTWRDLTNAVRKIYNYSWVYWTPFGNAVVVGPRQTTSYLDIAGTGAWTDFTQSNYPATRDYGSSVMYDTSGKILIAGGAQPPTNTAEIIDISATTPTWQYTNPMAFPRRHLNMTLLPDDNVLVTGGTSGDGFNDTTQPVYPSEMWNPTTQTWTTLASQTVGRFYHSSALLLPDGRVLSMGGNYTYQTEIYSPPYLFKGARPTITSVPSTVPYSAPFFVATPDATSIANVRLIRLPAVTHAFDQNQRILKVSFTQTTGGLNVTAPSDHNQAPIGHYMLFLLNGSGVPSVAKIIRVGVSPTPPAAPAGLTATAVSNSVINLSWMDQANNEDTFKIERKTGAGAFAQIATVGPNITTYADSGLTANTAYSYQVRASNTAGDSAYSNTASATTQTATVPGAPTGLVATVASDTTINLTWVDQSTNETGFKIERALGAGAFSQVATVGTNVTTYSDSGLTAATSYSYQVRATNTNGDSAYSNTASATTSGTTMSGTINMSTVVASTGFAYWATQNFGTPADISSAPTRSVLRIFENGVELGPAHSLHSDIRTLGAGRFSHWDDGSGTAGAVALLFSASDNTNPKTNGRTYTYQVGFSLPPPTAPSGLSATATSGTSINLTWVRNSTNETSFKIERALGAGTFSQVGTVGAGVTTYADSGLTAGTSYSYRVRASNTSGDSAYSNTASATTGVAAPTAPSGLVATATSSSAITVSWTDASTNEDGFKIERKTGAGAFAQIATVGPNITTYADSGLTANTAYSYQVRAYNTGGDSTYSNTASTTTLPPIPAPPTGLGATATSSSAITVSWTDASTNEDGFKIERQTGAGGFVPLAQVGPNITTYADSGLTASTAYSYQVRAYNTGGESAFSNTASATTGVGAPAAPSGLSAVAASGTSINLTWVSNSTNETSFKIERALGAGAFSQVGTVGAGVTTYADSGLTAGTSYSYRVRASNTGGDSAYSNTATATTGVAAPAAPSGLSATTSFSTSISLSWVSNSTNETSFKIERALGAGAFSQVGTVGAGVTTYTDNGLTAGTNYSYRVRASNSGGDSAYSNTASATTLPSSPTAPSGLSATTASSTSINLTWVSNSTNETSFKIERALGAGAFSQVGTVGAGVTTYADSGLTAGTSYSYRVRASNAGGDSAYSNTATATTTVTAPAAPSGLSATTASSTSINLVWVSNSTNETSFKIERALGAGAFSQVGTVGAGVTTYADSGLTAGTSYSYRVRASNAGGDSAYSNTATATTTVTAPAAPSGLSATTASSTSINLVWVSNSTNETSFKIERALGAGAFSQVGTVGPGVTTYADSGLTAGTSYSYRVRASNASGDSAYSNTASATTGVMAPAAPTGLSATAASDTAINLVWVSNSTNETSFKIERALGAGAFSQVGTVGPGVTTYADSGLTAGTSYSYRVRASNAGGDSAYSNTATATTTGVAAPAAPSGLSAVAASGTSINLTWVSNSTNETSFKIERALGAGAFSQVGTVGAGVTTYADSGLTAGTSYSYRVRASNTGGDSAYSNTATATTGVAAPAAPSGLSATTSFSTSISLSWVSNSTNETSFKIERALGAGAFSQVGTVGAGVTTYTDNGLTAGTNYSYRVRASNSGGDSAYSNTASATTLPSSPTAPSGLSATTASSTSINLTWVSNSTNETSFKIERALGAGAFSQVGTVGAGVTTYADSGLTAGTSYSYRVRASNAGGDSAYSNTATATTTVTAPAAPSGLSATTASSTSINLVWVSNSTNETSFKIERALGAGAFSQVGTVGAGVTTYADSGLTAGTSYSYRVRASNTGGDSAYSNTASATTLPSSPAAPSGANATATSSTSITLTWVDQSTNETSFKIERALGAGAFSQVGTVGPNIMTYTDSGLTASTSYSYRVRASNTGGDSAYSNTASATTPATLPAAPTGLVATWASSTAINLTWTDQSSNETGFKIERKTGAGSFTQIATVGANITTYADSGLAPATNYTYRVRATNTGGDSAYSNTANATTSGVITMSTVTPSTGFAYWAGQNFGTPADTSSAPTRSILRIFENGIELGPAHSAHANIRTLGAGRFSHWDDGSGTAGAVALLFSASNNTNPKTNGRTYTYRIGSQP